MNFYDTVAEHGYVIKKEDNPNLIHLIKEDGSKPNFAEAHIVFHKAEKQIKGFLSVHDLIFDVNDNAIIYRMFRHMREDLKFFAEKARYDII